MLHFPSANTAAHRPSARDVAKLGELLDDDVWAFSNCRVDAPGRQVAEVDWFFYNARNGTIMVSEWKGFPQRVASATDTGSRWLLDGGMNVPNPIEQVSRQLDAVRSVLRATVLPEHFPAFDPMRLRIMQSVYSPQVDQRTSIERIRWGKVYGSLADLAAVVADAGSPSPLLVSDDGGRIGLAKALCALFRTTFPAEVEAKMRRSTKGTEPAEADAVQRISDIHRQLAALHRELAHLTLVAAGRDVQATPQTVPPAPQAAAHKPAVTAPQMKAKAPQAAAPKTKALTEHQRMHAHLVKSFKGVNGSKDAAAKALEKAWTLVLGDPSLHGQTGISVSLFGSVGTPLVKQHRQESLPKVLGMQLRKWCLEQTQAAGMKPRDVPGKPSNIRVR